MNIAAVKPHPDHSNIIVITDIDGSDWHYYQNQSTGELVIGYPIQLYDPVTQAQVFVFNPLGPHSVPILLKVVLPGAD